MRRYLVDYYSVQFALGVMCIFFFYSTATTELYTFLHTLSLHDALPIFELQTTSVPNNHQGNRRARAVTGLQRSPLLPDVPTVAESGIPGFEVSAWFAVFAPANIPAQALQRLQHAMSAVMGADDLKQQLRQIGAEPDTRSPAAFAAYLEQEIKKYAQVVKAAGLAPDRKSTRLNSSH